ncbi:MAG: NAD-dependent epimerase/dehydratase family protein [Erythrobacter sp.]
MNIFITGASGFVGAAATRDLVAKGHTVTAMSRSESSDAKIRAAGGEPVRCDLENVAAEHVGDVEAVIHSAAFVEAWGPKDAWQRFNVEGTRRMLAAAREAGVSRFIHIGTEAAIVHGQDIRGADETYPLAPNSPYPYCATKAQAERLVRDANAPGFTTLVLRPRFIWGPGDQTLMPTIEAMGKGGGWMWIGGGKAMTSTTHIDNLVHAIALALTKGEGGEAYFILDDGDVSIREMITKMAASRNLDLGTKSIPPWLASALGGVSEVIWRAFGLEGKPLLTRHEAMVLARDCTLVGEKAKRDLGYSPVISRDEGLAALARAA